jgi:hypothetical protein
MGLSHSPKVISDGLVLYLDATNTRSYSGTGSSWYDLSVYGYNSTLISSPTFINNKYGQLAFNGSTQYATVPHTSTLWNGQTYTLSLWAKKIGTGDQGTRGIMISKDINYIDHAYNGKTMASFRNNTGGQTLIYGNNPASYNEWRHYAFTYDGTIGILYENGAATGSTALSGNVVNSTSNPLNIGRWDGSGFYFNGCIAGAMVYNRALNADEILQNYNATKYKYILQENIARNGLALHYDMSDYRSAPFTGTNIFNISGGIGLSSELLNGPTYSSDFGGNILLDGSNDYIQLSSSYTEIFTAGTTVDVWIKFNSSNSWGRILDTSDGAGTNTAYLTIARWGTNNEVVLESRSSTTQGTGNGVRTTTTAISNGTIQNFTFVIGPGSTDTVSPESPRIYLNANLQATTLYGTQNNFVPYVVNKYVWIGRSAFSADAYLGANIYAYRIYNRALSAQEVLQNYNASKTRFGIS